jgi:hypothetical protein
MTRATILRVFVLVAFGLFLIACDSGSKSEPKQTPKTKTKVEKPATPTPPPPKKIAKVEVPKLDTPEEIEHARRAALNNGKYKEGVAYCEMAKMVPGKSDPQALLGCTMAACHIKDEAKAQLWSKKLPKKLMVLARKVCMSDGIAL